MSSVEDFGLKIDGPTLNCPSFLEDPSLDSIPEGFFWYNAREHALKEKVNGAAVLVNFNDRHEIEPEGIPVFPSMIVPSFAHMHKDEHGFLHTCFHKCRSLFTWQFFAGITLSFPLEHALWTKVWPFYHLAELLGLGLTHH